MTTPRFRLRPLAVAALGLLLSAPGTAEASLPAKAADLPLWEVTRDGRTLYLMGSIHLLRPEVYPLDEALYAAFDAAGVVAFELDFARMETAAGAMLGTGMYADGRTLRDVLPAELLADLERRVAGIGVPMQIVERMKPWLAAMTMSTVLMQQAGYDPESGIDMHFFRRAVEAGKEVRGLETVEQQLRFFEELDDAGQVAFLRYTLDVFDRSVAQLDRITDLWKRGAADAVWAILLESMDGQAELMERLLFRRNQEWIPHIEGLMDAGERAIVIVGMGHLVGEGSVVDLLRERGYTVRQVRSRDREPAAAA
jgi:uncharacterized protein